MPCGKLQPLAKAFDLYPRNKHVGTEAHKGSARMRRALQAAPPQVLEFGSADWLAVRQAQWRDAKVEGGPPCRVTMRTCSKIFGAND